MDLPARYRDAANARLIALIASSHEHLLGTSLVETEDVVAGLWECARPVVAHGTESDPLFFFANRAALEVFEAGLDAFVGMPSRLSAEAPLREEREAFMRRVRQRGFVDDYRGVRISLKGRRFMMTGGIVWNLVDNAGTVYGQAASFVPQSLEG